MANLITSAQVAALLGVSGPAITKAVKVGRLHYADPGRKLFDEAAVQAQWAANRRRKRSPRAAPVSAAQQEHDDSIAGLAKRKLKAETLLVERKVSVGPEGTVPRAMVEAALFMFYPMGRGALDSLHPKLLEQTDVFCPPDDPRYGQLFTNMHAILRNTWTDAWMNSSRCSRSSVPS